MFGKPLEEFIGQVRKFQQDNVTWEYTVTEIRGTVAVVEMRVYNGTSQLTPTVLIWDRGELSQHGFTSLSHKEDQNA